MLHKKHLLIYLYKTLGVVIFLNLFIINLSAETLKKCEWNNKKGIPCITVRDTPNTSAYSTDGVTKQVINKQDIINSGATDINDVLELVAGLDVFQSGPMGQSTSVFTRGSESNHTLVLLNGIAINDQSVTDGLHDFGQDFIQTIQQIEVYKGSAGAQFGPSAIAGAINLITAIDYRNSLAVSGFNLDNNSLNGNYTKITKSGWHLNFKGTTTNTKTHSAIAGGTEDDTASNIQGNLNIEKWINDNLKFRTTVYSRRTKADYDGSATDEDGYVSNSKMYTFQTGLHYKTQNTENLLTLHYHNYDREYENAGVLDEYDSESLVFKGERKIELTDKFSFGYGTEYKYDWGAFENRGSYTASTKGHMKDLGIFSNTGYKVTENSILSFYGRSDHHNTTDRNETYKLNFTQFFGQFKLGVSHSTGLRNPTLFELYGTDNYGIKGNINLNPEKSETNELSAKYNFSDKLSFNSTAYRTKVSDRIESNAAYSKHENMILDINQEGLENELLFKGNNQSFSIFNNFSKSRKTNGQAQNRRPDLSYGGNYSKKFLKSFVGPFNLNLNYKYTGQQTDWDGAKNTRQKSTDIVNLSLTKNLFGNNFYLIITNLLNERYERPATYSAEGRQFKVKFRRSY